jgi:hypothetical protein
VCRAKKSSFRNLKLYRWRKGGLWILFKDRGWVRGKFMQGGRIGGWRWLSDEDGFGYSERNVSILKFEDYTYENHRIYSQEALC